MMLLLVFRLALGSRIFRPVVIGFPEEPGSGLLFHSSQWSCLSNRCLQR